jgi:chromosome segregation ATPase
MTSDDRLNRLENETIDLRLAVSALLNTVTVHQRNFEVLVTEIRDIRVDMRQMEAEIKGLQTEIRGLQTENRRILDVLQGLSTEEDS